MEPLPFPEQAPRRCPCCELWLLLSDFGPDRRQRSGLQRVCRACSWEAIKKVRQQYPERARAACHKYYWSHLAENRTRDAARRSSATQRAIAAARTRTWQIANPDKVLLNYHARRAKMRVGETDVTAARWRERLAEFGQRCAYCAKSGSRLVIEHMTPISRGGSHTMDNIVPACSFFNGSKHDSTLLECLLRRKIAHG